MGFLYKNKIKYIYIYIYIYTANDDRRRIIIIIIVRIKPLLKIFNECRSLTGVGEFNPHWRSSMNVEV